MLHNLNGIGDALEAGDEDEIKLRTDLQINNWNDAKDIYERANKLSPFGPGDWSVEQGIEILKEIRDAEN